MEGRACHLGQLFWKGKAVAAGGSISLNTHLASGTALRVEGQTDKPAEAVIRLLANRLTSGVISKMFYFMRHYWLQTHLLPSGLLVSTIEEYP